MPALFSRSRWRFGALVIIAVAAVIGASIAPSLAATTNTGPTSAFTASTLTVSFDGSASADPDGSIASYAWDFGDGSTGTGVTATHTYAAAGTYTVTLTVTDDQGAATVSTQSVTVTSSSTSQAGTTQGNADVATFTDDFATADSTKWSFGPGVSVANGQLQTVMNSDYSSVAVSNNRYDLTGSAAQVELASAAPGPNNTTETWLSLDDPQNGNFLWWDVVGGQLKARYLTGGTTVDAAVVTYDATADRVLRIREDSGTVYWDTSPDGQTWTNQATWAVTFDVTNLAVDLGGGYYPGAEPSGDTAVFDNLNLPPSTAPTGATTAAATLTPGDGTMTVDWSLNVGNDGANGAILSRDGTDTNGNGPWSSSPQSGTSGSFLFTLLQNDTAYNFTVQPTVDGTPVGTPLTVSGTPTAGGPPPTAACGDGVDNDGDGLTDYPADPGCTSASDTDETDTGGGTSGAWISGGSDSDSSFGDWRGSPQQSASTWEDSQDACVNQYELSGEFGTWDKPLVAAIGGLWGDSWSQAASGSMDSVWTDCLNAMASAWGSRDPSKLYISLFHEANGTWYNWSVGSGDLNDFHAAFHRFRTLQEQILPGANLMWAANADNLAPYSLSDMVPDPADYDVLGVDIYSMHDPADFDQFPTLAAADGKPLVVQEWGSKNDEQPGFVQAMHDKFVEYGGTGPGKMIMENYFNLNEYQLEPSTTSPNEAAVYRNLW